MKLPAVIFVPSRTACDVCAVGNSFTHGKKDADVYLNASVWRSADGRDFLNIEILNQAGANHEKGLALQKALGIQSSTCDASFSDLAAKHGMGSDESTFRGMIEVRQVTALIPDSTADVHYDESTVLFSFKIPLHMQDPNKLLQDEKPLPPNMVLIVADDERMPRLTAKPLAKHLGIAEERCIVKGETYEEAAGLVGTVLEAAAKHGDQRVICVFDENMDQYAGRGRVSGSAVTKQLREAGFQGCIFIRSANDSAGEVDGYCKAGADNGLSKRDKIAHRTLQIIRAVHTKAKALRWVRGGDPDVA